MIKKYFVKFCVISIVLCFGCCPLLAQDDKIDDFSFEDEQINNSKTPYFALSFGGNVSFLFMDYKDINNKPVMKNFI
jgi:hypothetical protein